MKYSSEIEINKPIHQVIELFDNPDHIDKWMVGLQSFELISGEQGQVGSKSRLIFKMGKREIEMIETITVRNLPEEFSGFYETKGVYNLVKNTFIAVAENRTKYISEQTFEFSGFMKVIGFLMPNVFKKQSMKYLVDFKIFVERY